MELEEVHEDTKTIRRQALKDLTILIVSPFSVLMCKKCKCSQWNHPNTAVMLTRINCSGVYL